MAIEVHINGLVVAPFIGVPEIDIPGLNDFETILFYDDLENVFFNLDEFARTCRFFHSALNRWVTYPIIFDDPHASVSLGAENEFNSIRPQFQISESMLAHRILKNDRVKLNGIEYRVEDYISDGVGVTTVYLRIK